jgi:hypothetical protein
MWRARAANAARRECGELARLRSRNRAIAIALLMLAACDLPKEVDPVVIYREVSGIADAGRLPPPGLDQPFPNLAVVPPRPERPPLAAREAISAVLAEDRARSREPLPPSAGPPAHATAPPTPGTPPVPAGPPRGPDLVAVRPVPWTLPPARPILPAPRRPQVPSPPTPSADDAPSRSGAARTAPAPRGGVPAASPLPDMPATPPAAPPAELLAPGSGPPPPPSPDLLAPAAPRLR